MKIVRFLSVEKLKQLKPINEDVDPVTLSKIIFDVQQVKIYALLGSGLYNKLIELIESGDVDEPTNSKYKELLDDYVSNALASWVYVSALPRMTFQFTDKGLQERNGNHSSAASSTALKTMVGQATTDAEFISDRVREYLCKNSTHFPEYQNLNGSPGTKTTFSSGGMHLDYLQ